MSVTRAKIDRITERFVDQAIINSDLTAEDGML